MQTFMKKSTFYVAVIVMSLLSVAGYSKSTRINKIETKTATAKSKSDLTANDSSDFNVDQKVQQLMPVSDHINPKVLRLALIAYNNAHRLGVDDNNKEILTVVDYSLPSTEKRMWVFDLKHNQLLYHTLVAHGKNSGGLYANSFSNNPESRKSSIGLYMTGNTYYGHHGYSLRLNGLDKNYNTNAAKRDIVVHSASYVSESFAKRNGYIGRSWGCLALPTAVAGKVIQTISDGTLIFAYAPNTSWEQNSVFLQS